VPLALPPPNDGHDDMRDLPDNLRKEVLSLQDWATANQHQARTDFIRFWALKLVAISSSALAALFTALELKIINTGLAAGAAVCVAIDGLYPGGTLHDVHLTAVYDLRDLASKSKRQYRRGVLNGEDPRKLEERILGEIQVERDRITKYLKDADTGLGKAKA